MRVSSSRRAAGFIAAALAVLLLSACGGGVALPQAMPTSSVPVVVTATPGGDPAAAPVDAEPVGGGENSGEPAGEIPVVSGTPLVVLPGEGGVSVACEGNTLRLPLAPDGQPAGAASRVVSDGEYLYLLVDGSLYRASLAAVDTGSAALEPLLPAGTRIAGPVVHEITDLALDAGAQLLYALDKAGHLYRLALSTGTVSLAYRATDDPDSDLTSEMLAVTVDERGRPVMLDTAFGALWTPADLTSLDLVGQSQSLIEGVDIATSGGQFYVLERDGGFVTVSQPIGSSSWQASGERDLPLSLSASDHLGIGVLVTVDALRREVTALRPGSGDVLTRQVFGFTDMGLLRDATFAGGRLYAVADGDLYVFPGPASGSEDIACAAPRDYARPTLYGTDVLALTQGWQYPIEGGSLPDWGRLYPGGSRIYRQGVHHGVDIYHWNAPDGFTVGWHVVAPADGDVTEATVGYVPMSAEEFDELVASSAAAGMTLPETLERFGGIQIELDHGGGVRTAYLHLNSVADGVDAGGSVSEGQFIGTVGVTGTEGEASAQVAVAHLHFEIWIGDRYLGQGIGLIETMWWFDQIFD